MTGADRQPPKSRLTLEVVLDVAPDHFYRQALEAVRQEDPDLAALLPPVPEGASAADVLDGWLSDEEPGGERGWQAREAFVAALESGVVVAIIDHLDGTDAEVGIELEAVSDEDEAEGDDRGEGPPEGRDGAPGRPDPAAGDGHPWWGRDATGHRSDREQTNMAPDDLRSNEL